MLRDAGAVEQREHCVTLKMKCDLLVVCYFPVFVFYRTLHPLVLDQNYINLKNQVIKAERRVLKELGFCVHVKHPHKVCIYMLFIT